MPYHQLAQAYRTVSPALKAKGESWAKVPTRTRFFILEIRSITAGFRLRPQTFQPTAMVYSGVLRLFDGLERSRPGGSSGSVCRRDRCGQFRYCLPAPPEEDLLLADTSFPRPHDQIYVREQKRQGGRKVYSYLSLIRTSDGKKALPWHCADIPFVFHNTELVPVCL